MICKLLWPIYSWGTLKLHICSSQLSCSLLVPDVSNIATDRPVKYSHQQHCCRASSQLFQRFGVWILIKEDLSNTRVSEARLWSKSVFQWIWNICYTSKRFGKRWTSYRQRDFAKFVFKMSWRGISYIAIAPNGPLTRYAKLRVRMRRECRERFPRHHR